MINQEGKRPERDGKLKKVRLTLHKVFKEEKENTEGLPEECQVPHASRGPKESTSLMYEFLLCTRSSESVGMLRMKGQIMA